LLVEAMLVLANENRQSIKHRRQLPTTARDGVGFRAGRHSRGRIVAPFAWRYDYAAGQDVALR
jgi:hypothetical protein